MFLSSCLLAWTYGLRHALDADHIAAIDNMTRKVAQDQKLNTGQVKIDRLLTIGFFFALGHSTVVLIVCIGIMVASAYVNDNMERFGEVGGIIGSSVSIAVLYILAIANLFSFVSLIRTLRKRRSRTDAESGAQEAEEKEEIDAVQSGFMYKIISPFFRIVDRDWKMFPVGFLFGLGFDTSTEVGLLALSASSSTTDDSLPVAYVIFLPLLFTAGMSLIDTLNGIMMANVYGWATVGSADAKLYFNLGVTGTSILFGVVIGSFQLFALLAEQIPNTNGPFWDFWRSVGDNSEIVGASFVALFGIAWAIVYLMYKRNRKEYNSLQEISSDEEKNDLVEI